MQNTDVVLKFVLDNALMAKKDEIAKILNDYGVPLVQCSDCVVAGDLPSHGAYDKARRQEVRGALPQVGDGAAGDGGRVRDQIVSQSGSRLGSRRAPTSTPSSTMPSWPSIAARAKFLLGKGADVNKLNDQGYAPLHTAARSRNSDSSSCCWRTRPIPTCPTATA